MNRALTFEARDEFNRKKIADKIISLIHSDINLSPMVVDGGWGKGKTEFCIKLMKLLEEANTHHIIYIDAFKADHANEPLLAILSEVVKLLPDEESQLGFIGKIIPALRFGLKTTAKAGVAHFLRQDAADVVEGFDKEIQAASDRVVDVSVESLLKDHIMADENLNMLQSALEEISQTKPITIFIDELDRCRPTFAVDFIEVIKHTLNVKGVDFVLITNKHQLKAAINHCYGHSLDSQRYLDKFLKFTIQLPDTHSMDGYHYNNVSLTHYVNLVDGIEVLKNNELNKNAVLSLVEHVIYTNDVSLREIETLVRHLEIYHVLANRNRLQKGIFFGYKMLCVFGILMFSLKPEIAKSITSNRADAKEIGMVLGEESLTPFNGDHPYPKHHQVVATMIGQECLLNSNLFTPQDDESIEYWGELIRDSFGRTGFSLEKGQRIQEVKKAIEIMNLHV